MTFVDVEWHKLSLGRQIKHLELQGFVLLPELLLEGRISSLLEELRALPTSSTTYSDKQHYVHHVQWLDCSEALEIVALPTLINFLEILFGDEIICTGCTYSRTEPGYSGMALHTDSQPYGSAIFGLQCSSPVLVRVLHYLSDLTATCAPLRLVPYSHLSLHSDANPYRRYQSIPQEAIVTCKAGSSVIINQKVFHAVGPNLSQKNREVFAVSYRPAWAGPIAEVSEYDSQNLANLPPHIAALFKSPNTQDIDYNVKNYSEGMATDALKLGPYRWEV